MKISVLILILFFAIIFLITPSKAQTIDPIKADTVFEGYGSGETSSIKFINHKRNLVYNHDGKLYEMSVTNYKPLRQIQLDESNPVTKFDIDENCKYIIYSTKPDTVTYIADYNTGKTLRRVFGCFYLTKDYLFLRTAYRGAAGAGVSANFTRLTINNLAFDSEFKISESGDGVNLIQMGGLTSKYDNNLIIYEVLTIDYQYGKGITKTNWYIIDPSTNTKRNSFSTGSDVGKLFVSKTGKGLTFSVNGSIYLYDASFKLLATISESELKKYYNDASVTIGPDFNFINNRYFIANIKYNDGLKMVQNVQVYDMLEKKAIKFIDFENHTSACEDDKFVFSNKSGCLATLSLDQLPVIDKTELSADYSLSYSNNNLLVSSKGTQEVSISIMYLTGVEVETLSNIYINEGSNTIPLNAQLANGLYFCIIKTHDTTISRKFMVIK